MANFFEILMLLSFGASWPINFHKAWQTKSTKGSSLAFLFLVEFGYTCGILAKILSDQVNYVLVFYIINWFAVAANIGMYLVNRHRESRADTSTFFLMMCMYLVNRHRDSWGFLTSRYRIPVGKTEERGGDILKAYTLLKEQNLDDIQAVGKLLRHEKSGARVVLIEKDDPNKVFAVGFRTPPTDSTGVPHIMEHSVLCGSRHFPVKDPFVELAKGSLNTFLNAITFPDKTLYPVASCHDKDFQNLVHIYMDAVFYPNIYQQEEIFLQEGWHYHAREATEELTYNGVVYNEMKGAFSSPEGILDRVILRSLFPDTCYANESGGDPEEIPNLTYRQFLDFHKTYYHPSNCYLYLYGDMDMEDKLAWLDREYLCHFDARQMDTEIQLQQPFSKMREGEFFYSISREESEKEKTYLSYNKVIGDTLQKELCLAFQVLNYVLFSAPGAPVKQALLDAGIGKDILSSYDTSVRQPVFSVIAKNGEASQKEAFVSTIEKTLAELVEKGLDRKALEAAINYYEFRFREADFGTYPKGLIYGMQVFDSWLYHEEEPFVHLQALSSFAFLREQIEGRYFEELIQTCLLDNPHGTVLVVKPQCGRDIRQEQALAKKLEAYRKSLSPADWQALQAKTKALARYQETPDDPANLAKIPVLSRKDLSDKIQPIYNTPVEAGGIPFIHHSLDTNGIGYVSLLFDLSGVAAEELPYVGILQSVLGMMDTEGYRYGDLCNEIHRKTGGITASLEVYPDVEQVAENVFRPMLELKGKALYHQLGFLLIMMEEIVGHTRFEDTKRLQEILDMLVSHLQMDFLTSGHTVAALRAQAYASPMARFRDDTDGVGYYQAIKQMGEHFDREKDNLICHLQALSKMIFCQDNLTVSYTSESAGLRPALEAIQDFQKKLPAKGTARSTDTEQVGRHGGEAEETKKTLCTLPCTKRNEGLKTASQVQYVAQAGNFLQGKIAYTGALQVLTKILNYGYLWQHIRVQGGAYGCMSHFNRLGEGCLLSYRDPHLKHTLQVYQSVVDYLRHFTADERTMNQYVIGTISRLDHPLTPYQNGVRSMGLYMSHITEEMLSRERKEILQVTQEDIQETAGVVQAILGQEQICVIGNEEKIEQSREIFGEVRTLC